MHIDMQPSVQLESVVGVVPPPSVGVVPVTAVHPPLEASPQTEPSLLVARIDAAPLQDVTAPEPIGHK